MYEAHLNPLQIKGGLDYADNKKIDIEDMDTPSHNSTKLSGHII